MKHFSTIFSRYKQLWIDIALFIPKNVFLLLGKCYSYYSYRTLRSNLFLLFPWQVIGGADKVNREIVHSLLDFKPTIILTDKFNKRKLTQNFPLDFMVLNFSKRYLNGISLVQRFFFMGIIISIINNQTNPIILGSNSYLFYQILPYIHKKFVKIDVLHAISGYGEVMSFTYVPLLTNRVFITPSILAFIKEQYKSGDCMQYLDRIHVIPNGVDIPEKIPEKSDELPLRVIYVGRESPEKRVYLIGKIAKRCHERSIPARFSLIGVSSEALSPEDGEYCSILGEITEEETLNSIYRESDIILIVSLYEGFPLVIMEGMANGVIPIATSVGGIADHIRNGKTGYLVENTSEEQIVEDISKYIGFVSEEHLTRREMQNNVYNYAKDHFSLDLFHQRYHELISQKYR